MKIAQNKIIAYKFSAVDNKVYPYQLTIEEANALGRVSDAAEVELTTLTGKTCNYTKAERKLYAKLMQKELANY